MTQKALRNHVLLKPAALAGQKKHPIWLSNSPTHRPRRAPGELHHRKRRMICSTTFKDKEAVVEPETVEDVERQEPFDWNKCWYAVAIVNNLEPKRPTPVKLLGRDFVLWRDVNNEWRCFDDACPHRLAPLSEGRIEPSDGSLMCSYHGWRFQSDGECTRIPQAKDGGASTGCKNPRSRAKAFPVKVERELVWIWPDDSPSAFIDSAAQELKGKDYYKDEKYSASVPWMREMPYPFDFLIENILDPAHLPFSHHGKLGSRDTASGHEARIGNSSVENELVYYFTAYSQANGSEESKKTKVIFNPPDLISYVEEFPGFSLQVRATPTSSTSSKTFLQFFEQKQVSLTVSFLRAISFRPWYFHLFQASIEDGDTPLINGQASRVRQLEEEGKGWASQYYMPMSCDAAVVGFRSWLHGKIGGGGPKQPNGSPLLENNFPKLDRRQLLDRYNSHTKYCKICSGTLRNVKVIEALANVAFVGFAAYSLMLARAVISGSAASRPWMCAASVCFLFLCGFISRKMSSIKQQLIFVDYEHWKPEEEKNLIGIALKAALDTIFPKLK